MLFASERCRYTGYAVLYRQGHAKGLLEMEILRKAQKKKKCISYSYFSVQKYKSPSVFCAKHLHLLISTIIQPGDGTH